jgi:cation diffusion facilitator CzcD-associated flavoprotein CzcO
MTSTHAHQTDTTADQFDLIIIGAGLSGIGTAYWLQKKCPAKNFTILEARNTLGGTWDLFRYPGIRSDSDMFTFGYRFKPWRNPQSLSDGPSILKYLEETATENGIRQKIRFGHKVVGADWNSEKASWHLTVETAQGTQNLYSRFLSMCSGYYNFNEAYRPSFSGEALFRGQIVEPQFWPEKLDYSDKEVVVVGSGASAVTIVPEMAASCKHVTMLQRSPTYIMTLPNRNKLFQRLSKWVSQKAAYRVTRWRNLLLSMIMFRLTRVFPHLVKRLLIGAAAKQLPPGYNVHKHFNPAYNPWDQRLCVVPDGDLFGAIRSGKASVETDEIRSFMPTGIRLRSGKTLEADIVVLATGLKIMLLGGAEIWVEGKQVHTNEVMMYKGMMISDVPNFTIAFGYTNASWTLKTDLTANYLCKLLNYMDRKKYTVVTPRKPADVEPEPFLHFTSGYVLRADGILPRQGSRKPWRVYQNYLQDMFTIRYGRIADGVLEFKDTNRAS